jgi:membrane protease YdiL (CAAX protease family)
MKTAAKQPVPTVPWNPWGGVAFVLVVFYAAQLIAGLLLWLYPLARQWSGNQTNDWFNTVSAQFVFILLAETLTVGAIYWFLWRRKLGLSAIGLRKPRWIDASYALAAVVPYYVLYILTVGVTSSLDKGLNINQQQKIGFNDVHGGPALVMTFISLVILPPLAEEIMVRGFLYSSLKKAMRMRYAVILTSALFAAAHLPEGGSAGPLYIAALDTFVLSLVLIYLREKTGSLWASIGLHAIKNGVAFVALFVLHAN